MVSGTFGARGVIIDDKLYIGGGDCKVCSLLLVSVSLSFM